MCLCLCGNLVHRYNSRRERTKFKRALQKAEWVERMAAKTARTKALEEEEAKKIPYEVGYVCVVHVDIVC